MYYNIHLVAAPLKLSSRCNARAHFEVNCNWFIFAQRKFQNLRNFFSETENEAQNRQMKNLDELQKELVQMKRKLNDASSK